MNLRSIQVLTVLAGLGLVGVGHAAPVTQSAPLRRVWGEGAGEIIPDSLQTTRATWKGARTRVVTQGLTPGHAYTMWFVFFNHPEHCVDSPQPGLRCGVADMFNPATGMSVVYGDGLIASGADDTFVGRIQTGVAPTGEEQIAMGDGVLKNPLGAEYQCVIRHHGPADPEYPEQTTTLHGGCHPGEPYTCSDDQAAGARASLPVP